jgi:hypothetical protein
VNKIKDFLKNKAEMVAVMSLAIIGDVIPIIFVMVGLWAIQHAARVFGFEEHPAIKMIMVFSEIFMVILYLMTIALSARAIYKLFKGGEL